jgi:hypothetical protein
MESQYIAIGGLLKKQEKSARWVSVKDENLLFEVLCKIREEFDPEWLFSLGTYSPRRHRRFEELGLFGSDYKGWIFNYTHRNRRLEDLSRKLEDFERSKLKPYWRKFSSLANRRDRLQRQLEGPGNRRELATAKRDLDSCYAKLLDMRGQILGVDGLPKDYKRLVKEFAFLVNTTEQEIRIRDIQRHILTKVFAQM